ncbi:hypothetical protein ACEPAG_2535 [Sanghuangporus baumii]
MSSYSSQQTSRFGKWPDVAIWPEGAEVKTFKGSCHCGKFKFDFDHPSLDVQKPASCNCSFCTRSGALMVYGKEKIRFDETSASRDELSAFRARLLPSAHHFCPGCGNYLFWEGMGMVGVNARMFEGIEVDKLSVIPIDGRSRSIGSS